MTHDIPEHLVSRLSEFVNSKTGLYYPEERWRELKRGIVAATCDLAKEYNISNDPVMCIHRLLSSSLTQNQLDILVKHLTIGETYYFRDKNLFKVLEEKILSGLIDSRRENRRTLRLWSAGCCTGEEPYSLAMLIDKIMPLRQGWDISILATDINTIFLQKAEGGIYTNWSFRDAPEWVVEKYFKEKNKNSFEISQHMKDMVTFRQLNLAQQVYPQMMDMILCRNVIMYFAPELRTKVIRRLSNSLSDGGWLIFSPGDIPHVKDPDLCLVRFPEAILYRKGVESKDKECQAKPVNSQLPVQVRTPQIRKPRPGITKIQKYKNSKAQLPVSRPHSSNSKLQTQYFYQKAIESANLGKLDEAEDLCKKAVNNEKLHPGIHYLLATIYQEQGRLKESARTLKDALYLDPKFVLAHFALGNLMQREGRFAESEKHLRNTLSLLLNMNPEDILPHSEGLTAGRLTEMVQSMLSGSELK
ncbi:MAG: chemotaxis protein CheR [Desulfobacteraceae bacterium]|nr:chemotaxis protein CheR [Desulfobacteraceae bacterium]